jgi:ABC-2 type transport system ATP-binding protein
MLRMLNLGVGLLHDPPLILLDEPTVGIDRAAQRRFRTLLRELKARGKAILLTTHDLHEAELVGDHVLVLADGRLRGAGRMDDLIADAFGARRELRVMLEPADVGDDERCARRLVVVRLLERLGLDEEEADTIWVGLVDPADAECKALLRDAEQPVPVVVQWTMGKPGLGRLIDWLSEV